MAMILVTHDLGVVAGRADDIAVMYAGRIVEKAPTRTLFREMRHPYSEALLESIPKLEAANHTRLAAISGRPPDLVNLPPGCKFAPRCPNVQPKCIQEEPPLIEHGTPGHEYACYFPVGSREGAQARARNVAAGINVAAAPSGAVTGGLG
jgi:peptide/nickel transport system ATP-binding protein